MPPPPRDWTRTRRSLPDQVAVGWRTLERMLVVQTPYEVSFVEALKVVVPYQSRRWDSERKVWLVGLPYLGTLLTLLDHHFTIGAVEWEEALPAAVRDEAARWAAAREAEGTAQAEEAMKATKSAAPVVFTWAFPSSGGATVYETLLREDGTLSCNCPGWVFNPKRTCTHTRQVAVQGIHFQTIPGRKWMGEPDQDPLRGLVLGDAPPVGGRKVLVLRKGRMEGEQ